MRERLRQHDHWLEKAVAIDGIYGVGLLVMGFLGLVNKAAFDSAVYLDNFFPLILIFNAIFIEAFFVDNWMDGPDPKIRMAKPE